MNSQDDVLSNRIDIFGNHYVLVFDLTSMQDATKIVITQKTSWRTIETGAKLYFPSRTR